MPCNAIKVVCCNFAFPALGDTSNLDRVQNKLLASVTHQ